MFYSQQVNTSLAESISNYNFKEEKKTYLQQQDSSNHHEMFSKIALLPLVSETLKNTCKEVQFLIKLRQEAYSCTKNQALCRHFLDNFTQIQSICFSCLEFQDHLLWKARLSGYYWTRPQIERTFTLILSYYFPSGAANLQGFFDISIFHFL